MLYHLHAPPVSQVNWSFYLKMTNMVYFWCLGFTVNSPNPIPSSSICRNSIHCPPAFLHEAFPRFYSFLSSCIMSSSSKSLYYLKTFSHNMVQTPCLLVGLLVYCAHRLLYAFGVVFRL